MKRVKQWQNIVPRQGGDEPYTFRFQYIDNGICNPHDHAY
jgi:hypothetical protein